MRKTIAGLMAQGMSLEDIHKQMEEILNEEYKKREQEQKALEIAAARDRAAHALVDYLSLTMGDYLDEIDIEDAAHLLEEIVAGTRMKLDIMEAFCAPIKEFSAGAEDEDEVLRKFLQSLGN